MRLIANEKYITRREVVGRYAGIGSILIVIVAFVLLYSQIASPLVTPLALVVALTVGVLLSFIGGYYGERFGGPLAHHLGVRAALKGLGNRFVLFQYVLSVPHVLLGPDGLTVIVVRSQGGEVTYADGRWSHLQRGKFLRGLAGQEKIGRPELEVEHQVERMMRYLEKHLPGVEVPVRGVVLFTNPDVQLDTQDPPLSVFYGKRIRSWLRGSGMRKALPDELWQQLAEQLVEAPSVGADEESQ